MGKVISLNGTPERIEALLEDRYAGYAAWEALRMKDFDVVCRECLVQLQEEQPLSVACRMMELIGIAYYYLGDYRASLKAMDQVVMICAVHPVLQVLHAECLGRLGRGQVAIDLLVTLTQSDLDSEELMIVAGSLEFLGAYHRALKVASEACAKDPYQARYLIDLSYYTYKVHGLVQSVPALAWQAVRLEPNAFEYRVWLSRILSAMQSSREAYEVVAEANTEQINSVQCACCLVQIAQLYETHGDRDRVAICGRALQELGDGEEDANGVQASVSLRVQDALRAPSTVDGVPYGDNDQ